MTYQREPGAPLFPREIPPRRDIPESWPYDPREYPERAISKPISRFGEVMRIGGWERVLPILQATRSFERALRRELEEEGLTDEEYEAEYNRRLKESPLGKVLQNWIEAGEITEEQATNIWVEAPRRAELSGRVAAERAHALTYPSTAMADWEAQQADLARYEDWLKRTAQMRGITVEQLRAEVAEPEVGPVEQIRHVECDSCC